jgi:hypothetical protein
MVEKNAHWRAEIYVDFAKYVSFIKSRAMKYQAYGTHGSNGVRMGAMGHA